MKRKIIALSAVAALATTSFASTDVETRLGEMEKQIQKLEKKLKKSNKKLNEVKAHDSGDNIKFNVDFRTAVDKISYTSAAGNEYGNDALLTNRLLLNMGYQATDTTIFKGALSYHKVFGATPPAANGFPQRGFGYDTFDWVANETASSDKLTVKEAYWLYMNDTFLGTDIAWTASVGRRPSTNGFLANLRDDTKAQSPMAHTINVEFDGASFKWNLDKVTGVSGMSWKLCLGRGLSDATPRFDMSGGLNSYGDYSESTNPDTLKTIDLAGFIFVPYDDGQYKVETTYYKANNLPGFTMADGTVTLNDDNSTFDVAGTGMVGSMTAQWDQTTGAFLGMTGVSMNSNVKMKTMGDLSGAAISLKVDGIGDGINDFLDDTTFFASYAQSKTSPDNKQEMINLSAFDGFVNNASTASEIATYINSVMATALSVTQADYTPNSVASVALANTMASMATSTTTESGMLGSNESQSGHSIYMGVQIPAMITDDGRFGFEYNKGSKYWRSFTYAEDTMAGSKLATRGSALEAYYIQPIDKALTFQARYTTIKYDYTGSQAFFGDDGTPMTMAEAQGFGMDPIEKATDLRVSISYKF